MNGDELLVWIEQLRRTAVAYEMKRDDLAGAIAELTPAERLQATATMQRLALLIGNVGGILTMLTEQGLQTEPPH